MSDRTDLSERRVLLKSIISTAGIALAAPMVLSTLSPEGLTARASGRVSVQKEPPPSGRRP